MSHTLTDTLLLSSIVFVPSLTGLLLLLVPSKAATAIKGISILATLVTFALTLWLLSEYTTRPDANNDLAKRARAAKTDEDVTRPSSTPTDSHPLVFRYVWIETNPGPQAFRVEYYMGVDGISLPLVLLTGLVSLLSMIASWNIAKQIKGFCILFLLLETGMMGTFLSLDFFLFYVFWEVMLLPMYFLIGIWGAPSRTEPDGRVRGGPYAAIKFFIYTLAGSVLMLIALLAFYFYPVAETKTAAAAPPVEAAPAAPRPAASPGPLGGGPMEPRTGTYQEFQTAKTFDLMKLAEWGMKPPAERVYGPTFQIVMFILLYIGFAIKVPVFPFHTWLPDAHVEAPTPISMILAGVLLKMGGYGLIRIAYPLCPEAAHVLAPFLATIGVWNIIYGAFAAMAQTDFKKLVAYSSISHMGYVILGIAVWGGSDFQSSIWASGMNGAMFQMIAHGISSPGMFFLVGVIYDRAHHRDLNRFGGLATEMPVYSGIAAGIFFAGLGLPGLCGFVGEAMTVLASWQYSKVLAVIAALGVILTAGYILWTIQRVFFGASKLQVEHATAHGGGHDHGHGDDHGHAHDSGHSHGHDHGHSHGGAVDRAPMFLDITFREMLCAVPLLILCIALGIYPNLLFSFMQNSVTSLVESLHRAVQAATSLISLF